MNDIKHPHKLKVP